MELTAYLAAEMFNEGHSAILMVMNLLQIKIGQQCKIFADNANERRVRRQNNRYSFSSKEARTARRLENMNTNELYEEEEGILYGAGIAD